MKGNPMLTPTGLMIMGHAAVITTRTYSMSKAFTSQVLFLSSTRWQRAATETATEAL
jgi:hypothetical protein